MQSKLVLIDRQALQAELQEVFDARTVKTLLNVLDKVVAQVQAAGVTREDFSELKQIVAELAKAQRRSEERLSRLEETVAALAEAQRRSEERLSSVEERLSRLEETVAALAEAQRRTEQRVEELAEAQRRSEERLSRLEETVAALAEAQRRTEQRVEELAEAQRRTEERLSRLEETVAALTEQVRQLVASQQKIVDDLGGLKGKVLELTYHNKAAAYFGPLLRRVRVVSLPALEDELEARLSPEGFKDVLLLDLVVSGQPRHLAQGPEVLLAVEVSSVVDEEDVTRARRRAELLRQAGYRAVPVVAGERVTLGAEDEARQHKVVVLQDGQSFLWDEALAAWVA